MKRRNFLHRAGLTGLIPSLPKVTFGATATIAGTTSAGATSALGVDAYLRAETLVRAQKVCNLSMIEHLLQIDAMAANELRSKLVANGVLSSLKTARGMCVVTKPLTSTLASSHQKISQSLRQRFRKAKLIAEQADEQTGDSPNTQPNQDVNKEPLSNDASALEAPLENSEKEITEVEHGISEHSIL